MDGLTLDSPASIRELVRELCARQVPGWLRYEGAAHAIAGYFSGTDTQFMRFNLASENASSDPAEVGEASCHRIEFVHRGRARGFECQPYRAPGPRSWWQRLARPGERAPEPASALSEGVLLLQLPERVDVQHKRRAFRIPVKGVPQLMLRLSHGANEATTQSAGELDLVDISAVGMAVRRAQEDQPAQQWRLGQQLSAHIELGQERILVTARCERVTPELVGFAFPESLREQEVEPPLRLARILGELERRWLRRRSDAREARAELSAAERTPGEASSEASPA